MLGLIATRSINEPVLGIDDLVARARARIVKRHRAPTRRCKCCARGPGESPDADVLKRFEANQADWAMRCCCCDLPTIPPRPPRNRSTPPPGPRFPMFRCCSGASGIMVGLGLYFIALFATAFYLATSPPLRTAPLVPQAGIFQLAPALDRDRTRLDRRGIRPATLGGRRCASHIPRRVAHLGRQCLAVAGRIRGFLLCSWPSWTPFF